MKIDLRDAAWRESLAATLTEAGEPASELSLQRLTEYFRQVTEVNKVMNLTAVTEPEDILKRHLADTLTLFAQAGIDELVAGRDSVRFADVGTGAGIPGFLIALLRPEWDVYLFDSLLKRLRFLDDVTANLGVRNVVTCHGRAEDLGRDPRYRETFDLVTARAVAPLNVLLEYCLPFVREDGYFIAMKGDAADEVAEAARAAGQLGGKLMRRNDFELAGTDWNRSLIIYRKIKKTPKRFPRKAGTPKARPI